MGYVADGRFTAGGPYGDAELLDTLARAIAGETVARQAGDTALADAIAQVVADLAETVSASALEAETVARTAADTTLTTAVGTKASTTALNAEITRAQNAEAAALALADAAVTPAELDTALTGFIRGTVIDTDGTLAANSDAKLPSQKAVKNYVDAHAGGGGVSSPYVGGKWNAVGTSITQQGQYTGPLATLLGANLTNFGVGGATLSTASAAAGGGAGGNGSVYAARTSTAADAALITVEAGINDFLKNVPLGTPANTTAGESFYGALHAMLLWLVTNRGSSDLAFLTPYGVDPNVSYGFVGSWNHANEGGATLADFVTAIKVVCARFGVPVIKLGDEIGFSGPNIAGFSSDGLHPSALGGRRMAGYLAPRLILAHITVPAAGNAPANTVAPVITTDGTPQVGETVSVSNGTWTNSPTSYAYQWQRDLVAIGGATASTYLLDAADATHSLTCLVTATNASGSAGQQSNSITPAATAGAPVNTVAPAVTGTAQTGNVVSVSTGTWTNSPTSYAYQWKRNGANIAAATASTYTLQAADEGTSVVGVVTATNGTGSNSATSNSISPTAPLAAPVNTVAPAVTGTSSTGFVLTSTAGTWTGNPAPAFTYQWKRNGSNIAAATASTYTLQAADEGTSVKCTATATNSQGAVSQDSNTINATAFSPYAISNLEMAFDETGIAGFADTDPVTQWSDTSGHGRHAVPPLTANQPVKRTNVKNGQPVVRFLADDYLQIPYVVGVTNPSDMTILVVAVDSTGAPATGALIGCRGGSTTKGWYYRISSAAATVFAHGSISPSVTDNPTNNGTWNIYELVRTGLSAVIGHNGTMAAPVAMGGYATAPTTTEIGIENSTTLLQPLSGDIAAIYVYSKALSDAERDAAETFLGTKYGITVV